MMNALDQPLFFLGRPRPHVLDVALLRLGDGKVVLLFPSRLAARSHLETAPPGTVLQTATDLRAKEELFRAALARGADELWLYAEAGAEPDRYPLQRALDYVMSFKRQTACI